MQALKQQLNQIENHLENKGRETLVKNTWLLLKKKVEQQIINIEKNALQLIEKHINLKEL